MASYPWLSFSSQTAARQRDINMLAVKSGKCPPLVEDGKLGPTTCGVAAHYVGVDALVADMKRSCKQTKSVSSSMCRALPWNRKAKETATLQAALNSILVPQGFCKMKQDGILGPTTCAGAKRVLGSGAGIGCKQTGTLRTCAAASKPTAPLAPPLVADTPVPVKVAPPPPPSKQPAPAPPKTTAVPKTQVSPAPMAPAPPQDDGMGMGMWAIVGAGVLVVGTGSYFLLRKK